jgi:hypothetical protein
MGKFSYSKGCGCLLVAIGGAAVVFAVLLALGSIVADDQAGDKNQAEWEAYNAWTAQLDSMDDQTLADSLRETRQPPIIRQGGFASLFGTLMGLGIMSVATIPLAIGGFLLYRHRRQERRREQALMDLNGNDNT